MLVGTVQWIAQERVIHGKPAAQAACEEFDRTGVRRVLLTTTRSLTSGRLVAGIIDTLGGRCVGKFDAIPAHSPREAIVAGADLARRLDADHLLAVGGGSVIDATKGMLLALWRNARDVEGLSSHARTREDPPMEPLASDRMRMTAVATTLSAAEFSHTAGVTDVQRKVKISLNHGLLVPRAAILDPAATLDTPAELLLSTGVRALDHAVERWCSLRPHPLGDAMSLQAMQMLARSLPAIKACPDDLEPRLECQMAAWLTQVCNNAGVPNGASHGIGYILGGYAGVPHGITSCISLAATLEWNEPVNAERQKAVAERLGRAGMRPCDALREFVKSLGLPTRLGEVGIGAERIPELARQYKGHGPISTNPRRINRPEDLEEILRLAL